MQREYVQVEGNLVLLGYRGTLKRLIRFGGNPGTKQRTPLDLPNDPLQCVHSYEEEDQVDGHVRRVNCSQAAPNGWVCDRHQQQMDAQIIGKPKAYHPNTDQDTINHILLAEQQAAEVNRVEEIKHGRLTIRFAVPLAVC